MSQNPSSGDSEPQDANPPQPPVPPPSPESAAGSTPPPAASVPPAAPPPPATPATGYGAPPPVAPPGYGPAPTESGAPGGYPPAPGYAPPPGGGYGPPAGGYAPPPPPGGYAAAPASGDIVIDGVKYGWKKFTENVGAYLLGGIVWFVGLTVLVSIAFAILLGSLTAQTALDASGNLVTTGGGGLFSLSGFLFIGVAMLLVVMVQAAYLNASLHVASGRRIAVGDFFKFPNLPNVFATALVVGILIGVGYSLFFLPGLIVQIFTTFAIIFALDRGFGPVEAIKASIDLVKRNFVTVLLLMLAVYVVTAIGSALCGIGILVAYPIACLATVYVYRRVQGQAVAP